MEEETQDRHYREQGKIDPFARRRTSVAIESWSEEKEKTRVNADR